MGRAGQVMAFAAIFAAAYFGPKVWAVVNPSPAAQCERAKRDTISRYDDAVVVLRKMDGVSERAPGVAAAFMRVSVSGDSSDPIVYRALADMDLSEAPMDVRRAVHEVKDAAERTVRECGY